MTQYQRITLKESGEEFVVDTMEYPYTQAGILYLKFIVYDEVFGTDDVWHNQPVTFLTLQPQDILKREYEWTEAGEYELITASEKAIEEEKLRAAQETKNREMYQKMVEEEMRRKAALTPPAEAEPGQGEMFG